MSVANLRGVTLWLWVICERCLYRSPTALAPWIIRWGADASSNMLRRSARCTQCDGKGATIQIPGLAGLRCQCRSGRLPDHRVNSDISSTFWAA
jgi:hypothetical protein